jgi:hypothetical protein
MMPVSEEGRAATTQRAATAPPASTRSLVLVVMCVGYFLVLLDVTVINVALPQIGRGLGADMAGAAVDRGRLRAGAGRAAADRRHLR